MVPDREICGVENAALVTSLLCNDFERECEIISGCCKAEGFDSTEQNCLEKRETDCAANVQRNLETGACFNPALLDSACRELTNLTLEQCTILPLLANEFQRLQLALNNCDPWTTRGRLVDGETCTSGEQCAQEPGQVSNCIPDFASDSDEMFCDVRTERLEGESCTGDNDLCAGLATCASDGVCRVRKELGESCEQNFSDCDSFHCSGEGVCIDATGDECNISSDCGSLGICGDDNRCVPFPFGSGPRCDFSVDSQN